MAGLMFPKPLKAGDRVALIAPSGFVSPERLELAVRGSRDIGLEPVLGRSADARHGFLAGRDEERAADLNWAFADDSIAGIICIRGGYGAARILDKINYSAIAANPKVFCGYSDITALHTAINQRAGMGTSHTPVAVEFAGLDEYSRRSFMRLVFEGAADWALENPPAYKMEHLNPGHMKGMLCGGNLSILAASIGTPFEIETEGKILLIEEVSEPPYRVDRMLRQLLSAGKFADCAGVVFGVFEKCESENSPSIRELIVELGLNVPVIFGYRFGHSLPTASMPLGSLVYA